MFIYFHLVPLATSLTIHLRYNRITKAFITVSNEQPKGKRRKRNSSFPLKK